MPNHPSGDFFELRLVSYDSKTLMIDIIDSHRHYSGVGIPEVLLPFVSEITEMKIVSSSNMHKLYEKEFRSDNATKMWERLISKEMAYKDNECDRYVLVQPQWFLPAYWYLI